MWRCWFFHSWSPWRTTSAWIEVPAWMGGPGRADCQVRECLRCGKKEAQTL